MDHGLDVISFYFIVKCARSYKTSLNGSFNGHMNYKHGLLAFGYPGIQIISSLLVDEAAKNTINNRDCHHVTGWYESTSVLLSEETGWPLIVQLHPSAKTAGYFKNQLSLNFPTYTVRENY